MVSELLLKSFWVAPAGMKTALPGPTGIFLPFTVRMPLPD